ncbi:MAG TPA: tetratricopeptide repeat protein [Pseudonocardiaceae bacterium]|nr:tetratricopeptide repeat protein [Pseudonocardiaceae bacterium]
MSRVRPPAEAGVLIRLLGSVVVERPDGRVASPGEVTRTLLALLALAEGREVPADTLGDAVWGDRPTRSGSALPVAVHRLRRWLAEQAGADITVTRTNLGYRLDAGHHTDVARFTALVDQAMLAEPADRAELLAGALELWRDRPLADVPAEAIAAGTLDQLDRRRRAAVVEHATALLAVGSPAAAVDRVAPLAEQAPLDEGAHAVLIEALAATGKQAEALEVYQRLRETLADELGVDPGPRLRAAHLRVLRQEVPAERAEATRRVPAQLPASVSGFTGRHRELAELDRVLLDPAEQAAPIALVTGTAGVGKTALALRWAHRVAERFPDGRLHVDLHGYDPTTPLRPEDALAGFLRALGVPAKEVPAAIDEAAALFRSLTDQARVLVVLDNASSADQVRPLLPASSGCATVVTSRDRLSALVAMQGAVPVPLGVLSAAEAVDLLRGLLGERVGSEPQAARQLAELCANLPLALRVTAANLVAQPGRPLAEHVAELDAGGLLDTLDEDSALAVRAAFGLSYQRLSPAAQRMFRLLGLVPGPDIGVPAAAALAEVPPAKARRTLDSLVAAHLLDQSAPGRYTAHDLLREYGRGLATGCDGELAPRQARRRLHDWYLRMARSAARLCQPHMTKLAPPDPPEFADGSQAVGWLNTETQNLLATIRYVAAHGPTELCWQLADSVVGHLVITGNATAASAMAELGLAAAEAAGDQRAGATMLLALARSRRESGNHGEVLVLARRALALAERTGWTDMESAASYAIASAYSRLGQIDESLDYGWRAVRVSRRGTDLIWQAIVLSNLGALHAEVGRYAEATGFYGQSVELALTAGSTQVAVGALTNLGSARHEFGQFDEALESLDQALTLARRIDFQQVEVTALTNIAQVRRDAGQLSEALRVGQQALAVPVARTGHFQPMVLSVLGTIQFAIGDVGASLDSHREALALARRVSSADQEIQALAGLAEAYRALGRLTEARQAGADAVRHSEANAVGCRSGRALTVLARIELDSGDAATAIRHAGRAADVCRSTGQWLQAAKALTVLGDALAQGPRGDSAAAPQWRAALEIFADMGVPEAGGLRAKLAEQDSPVP